jgi:DNA invertase Pin-like site-specific DNA recombinase
MGKMSKTKKADAKRAAVYIRVSTEAQADEDRASLPDQARQLLALARSRGWQTVDPPDFEGRAKLPAGVFGDPGVSGDEVETRPGMVTLLAAVKAGGVGAVLVRDVNRLARSELAAQQIHAVLEAAGVALVTPAMDYDYGNLQHRLMLGLLGSIEAYAKRWLVQNMKRARDSRKLRGMFASSVTPYGFKWDKEAKRPVEVAEELEAVRLIFRLCVEERLSCVVIAGRLWEAKVPTRKGRGFWYDSQVAAILRNPCYKGEWRTGAKDAGGGPVLAADGPAAVIDPKVWAAAQRVMNHHMAHRGPRMRKDFLLGKLIFCECGGAMTGRMVGSGERRQVYYRCNRAIRTRTALDHLCQGKHVLGRPLDEAAWGMVEALARDPAQIEQMLAATERDQLPAWRRELRRTEKALTHSDFELTLARIAYRKGVNSLEQYAADKAELEKERGDLTARRDELAALIEGEEIRQQAVDRVSAEIGAVAERLDGMSVPERRDLLRRLHFQVTVRADGTKARITFAGDSFLASQGILPALLFDASTPDVA